MIDPSPSSWILYRLGLIRPNDVPDILDELSDFMDQPFNFRSTAPLMGAPVWRGRMGLDIMRQTVP
jgi:hypothetical protein